MIAVIADDFTGAAEIGGIGLRYGLAVEINTSVNKTTQADLLIVATDTRSMNSHAAVTEMVKVSRELGWLKPALIFKKVDSVLRGHIVQEGAAQRIVLGLTRTLLVPANPALGRTIRVGTYFLHGRPIHLSAFSEDPEFAITGSGVHEMLKADEGALSRARIILGEAETTEDLAAWAERLDPTTLPAGSSGFFTAILDKMQLSGHSAAAAHTTLTAPPAPCLFVCGSSFERSRNLVRQIKESGGPVSYLPQELAATRDESCLKELISLIRTQGRAIIAIEPPPAPLSASAGPLASPLTSPSPRYFRERMARLVRLVLLRQPVAELFIEGGSTAFAILCELGLKTFFPVEETAAGVIRLRVGEDPSLHVTVKPGSYPWPFSLLEPTTNDRPTTNAQD